MPFTGIWLMVLSFFVQQFPPPIEPNAIRAMLLAGGLVLWADIRDLMK